MDVDLNQIIINIQKNRYTRIGAGSGRRVFDLGNGTVVKMAKNIRGIAQNAAESKIASNDGSPLFARVLYASDDGMFLIMEKAELINHISTVWNYFNVESNRELYHVKALQELSLKHSLLLTDLRRPVNWGIIKGRPVIIDYGFTQRVRNRYY